MVLIFLPKIYYQHKQVRNDSDPLFIVTIKRLHPVLASPPLSSELVLHVLLNSP